MLTRSVPTLLFSSKLLSEGDPSHNIGWTQETGLLLACIQEIQL